MEERVGQQLGNYRLIRYLGEGGFAAVYLGEHIELGTKAAIKLLHLHLGNEDITSFRNEARTVAHLSHPHIVRVFDFDTQAGIPYLVMDYAPFGTLRERYPRGTKLPLSTVVTYVKQVASALQYAHNQQRIHRDVKPENMLLNQNNEILLSDFGLATIARSTARQNTETIAGTAIYMAPEMFTGKAYPASDQYSLAIVVYEWLTGHPPFYEGNFIQLGFQHSKVEPEPLSKYVPTIPEDVEDVLDMALAKDYKKRFLHIEAFASALEAASSGKSGYASSGKEPSGSHPKEDYQNPYSRKAKVPVQPIDVVNPPVSDREHAPSSYKRQEYTPPYNPPQPVQNPGNLPYQATASSHAARNSSPRRPRSSTGSSIGLAALLMLISIPGFVIALAFHIQGPILLWIFPCLFVGAFASIVMQSRRYGVIRDTFVGFIGAFIGEYLVNLFFHVGTVVTPISLIVLPVSSLIGACLLIQVIRKFTDERSRRL